LTEVASVSLDKNTNVARAQIKDLRNRLGGTNEHVYGDAPSLLAGALLDGVVSNAADGLYLTPQPARHAVYFPRSDTAASPRSDMAVAAFLGSGLLMPIPAADDDPLIELAARLLPSSASSAQPIDLFVTQPPRLFHFQRKTAEGEIHVVAIANRSSDTALPVTLPFAALGFTPGAYYTVYDFWRQSYLGTAADKLDVTVPPGDAALFVFRPFVGHPMLVSTGANLGQDWPALRRSDWDAQARTLTVELAETATTEAARKFTFAVPAPYKLTSVMSNTSADVSWELKNTSATVTLPAEANPAQGFTAHFEVAR